MENYTEKTPASVINEIKNVVLNPDTLADTKSAIDRIYELLGLGLEKSLMENIQAIHGLMDGLNNCILSGDYATAITYSEYIKNNFVNLKGIQDQINERNATAKNIFENLTPDYASKDIPMAEGDRPSLAKTMEKIKAETDQPSENNVEKSLNEGVLPAELLSQGGMRIE